MPPVGYRKFVLDAMPGTRKQLRTRTGLSERTITSVLKRAMEDGACHITGWERSVGRGSFQPTYAKGAGKNVPCRLKPLTPKEICSRNWKEIKNDERGDRKRQRELTRYHMKRMLAKGGDPMVAALFGRAPAQVPA